MGDQVAYLLLYTDCVASAMQLLLPAMIIFATITSGLFQVVSQKQLLHLFFLNSHSSCGPEILSFMNLSPPPILIHMTQIGQPLVYIAFLPTKSIAISSLLASLASCSLVKPVSSSVHLLFLIQVWVSPTILSHLCVLGPSFLCRPEKLPICICQAIVKKKN